jgi:hypothetical protein
VSSFSIHRKFLGICMKPDETCAGSVLPGTVDGRLVQVPWGRGLMDASENLYVRGASVSASGATCKGFPAGLEASLSLDCHIIATSREQQSQAA